MGIATQKLSSFSALFSVIKLNPPKEKAFRYPGISGME